MRVVSLLLLLFVFVPQAIAQPEVDASPEAALPFDPLTEVGELENGLRWYIRSNQEPENRAELRLVLNAGSLLEDDDQQGLAHFVEHMAFNGSENFESNELIDYMERIGMEFGPEVNAYTSFDETVYMLDLPNMAPDTLDLVLLGIECLDRRDAADVVGELGVDRRGFLSDQGVPRFDSTLEDERTPQDHRHGKEGDPGDRRCDREEGCSDQHDCGQELDDLVRPDVENSIPGADRDSVAKVSPFLEDLLYLEPELGRIVMLEVANRVETGSGHQSGLRAKAQT